MSTVNRRRFLQFTGAIATSLGLSQLTNPLTNPLSLSRQSLQYGRVLAQDTPRKLALLIGINNYSPSQLGWSYLRGCVNDTRMQRELLVHRFGFSPNDILTVTNEDATRDGIITAFQEHLIAQTRPGDVVVVHYSGHGSQVVDPNPYRDEFPLNSTFVPIDSPLPTNFRETGGTVNDIMGKTLFLLMSQLQTEQVTVVLDSCHAGGGKRGAVTFRAREGASSASSDLFPGEAERALQQRLQANLGWSDEELYKRRQAGIAKGVVIASAAETQLAADAYFSGFYAGAFSYLLTQYLWQQTGDRALRRAFVDIDRATLSLASTRTNTQNPEFETNLPADLDDAPFYFTSKSTPAAEAIALEPTGDRLKLWLGGVHPDSLRGFQQGAVFSALAPDGSELGRVQLTRDPDGLDAEGTLIDGAQGRAASERLFLQEQIRAVPQDLALRIGLDGSLAQDHAAVAAAIASLDRIQLQPLGSDDVDYFIGRLQPESSPFVMSGLSEPPPAGSVLLLYPDLSVVPDSWGTADESVADAVERLRSRFRTLLAIRIIRTVVNPGASDLRVDAAINVVGTDVTASASMLAVRGGQRGVEVDEPLAAPTPMPDLESIPAAASRLPLDTLIQIQVMNNENRPVNEAGGLYIAVLVIDSSGDMSILYPTNWADPDLAAFVESGQTVQIPDPERGDRFRLRISRPVGVTEILVIASAVPLRRTLASLGEIAKVQEQAEAGSTRGLPLSTSRGDAYVEVAGHLLDDMDQGTRGIAAEPAEPPPAARGINSRQLTALSLTFEVYAPT